MTQPAPRRGGPVSAAPPPRLALAALCLLLAAGVTAQAVDYPIRLVDAAADAGIRVRNVSGSPAKNYVVEANGNGAAWFDYDNDGDLDALVTNGSTLDRQQWGGDVMTALYRNDGRGRFTDVTKASGLTRLGWGVGVCVADYDNDGFRDVYVTAIGPNVLWRNNGDGTFTATGEAADARWGTGCAFADYDRDGHVDLYVANYLEFDRETIPPKGAAACRFMNIDALCGPRPLPGQPDVLYRNTGTGTFVDVTAAAGVVEPGYYGFGVIFGDMDDDGWPDIYVANDSVPNLFFRNQRDGTFVEEGLLTGIAVSGDGRQQAGMGVDLGDYDADGRTDLIVSNFAQDYTTLYRNEGGVWTDVSFQTGMAATLGPYLGWGIALVDMDNNGWLDVFVANGHVYPEIEQTGTSTYRQRNQLFRNVNGRSFRDITAEVGGGLLVEKSSRGAAFGDYDNDGDIDVLVIDIDDLPTLLRNDTAGGRWVTLRLVGTRSNRDAIGAKVTIEAGGRRQVARVLAGGSYASTNDARVHFGIGDASRVDRIEIVWPDGTLEEGTALDADRFYVATEGAGIEPGP